MNIDHPSCAPNGDIPYFWKFKGERGPGNIVTVLGGVHGNETVGVEVVHRLITLGQKCVKRGVLNLGIGNPEACKLDKRFIEKDLNRCFGENNGHTLEEERAEEIKPVLAATEVFFDGHSTLKPSRPIVLLGNKDGHPLAKPLIHQLGIKTLISGAGLWHPSGFPTDTDHYVAAHGGLGITVEAGWQKDQKVEAVMAGVLRALKYLGIFDENMPGTETDHVPEGEIDNYEAYKYIIAEPNFVFTQEWKNFKKIPAGTFVAFSNGKPIIAPKDSYVLFAKSKENIVVGQQACLLLQKAA